MAETFQYSFYTVLDNWSVYAEADHRIREKGRGLARNYADCMNGDLWCRFDTAVRQFPNRVIKVAWTSSHLVLGDEIRDVNAELDILYNNIADTAAKRGRSRHHNARDFARRAVDNYIEHVTQIHEFQLAVVERLWSEADASDIEADTAGDAPASRSHNFTPTFRLNDVPDTPPATYGTDFQGGTRANTIDRTE